MITDSSFRYRFIEFELIMVEGDWYSGDLLVQADQLSEMIACHRSLAPSARLKLGLDPKAIAIDLLQVLTACQETGTEFLFSMPSVDSENGNRKRFKPAHFVPVIDKASAQVRSGALPLPAIAANPHPPPTEVFGRMSGY